MAHIKKLLLITLILCSVRAEAAITKIAQVGCRSVGGANCTTGAVNGTGGNFIVIIVADASNGTTALSDSSSNSYAAQCGSTQSEATDLTRMRIFYKANATVSASMTFTATATSSFPSILVGVFSGVNTSAPCDQSGGNSNNTGVTSTQLGSVTPTVNGELVVSAIGWALANSAPTINSSFINTATANVDYEVALSSNNYGSGFGYIIQTTATATNPTWSWTTGSPFAGVNATFFATGTGPSGGLPGSLMLLGVGK